MNGTELRIARLRRHITGKAVGEAIGMTTGGYMHKERGKAGVSLEDAAALTLYYNLTFPEFIEIFFDGDLPIVCTDRESCDYKVSVRPLQKARLNAGVSEEEAAAALVISTASYKRMEFGHRKISLEHCKVLSVLYGLTIQEFNDIFFKGVLHFCKNDVLSYKSILSQNGGEINA